jgi:hypothetical protein
VGVAYSFHHQSRALTKRSMVGDAKCASSSSCTTTTVVVVLQKRTTTTTAAYLTIVRPLITVDKQTRHYTPHS